MVVPDSTRIKKKRLVIEITTKKLYLRRRMVRVAAPHGKGTTHTEINI
jgi:hypothetical protein